MAATGSFLEKHGNRLRVVVNVPPSLHAVVGKKKLKQALPPGTTLRQADQLKWGVIDSLKRTLREASTGGTLGDVVAEAEEARDAARSGEFLDNDGDDLFSDHLERRYEQLARHKGVAVAETFREVATGRVTPLKSKLKDHVERRDFSKGYAQDIDRALGRLEEWCVRNKVPASLEAITMKIAGDFVHDAYIRTKVHHKTGNKDISSLSTHWRYLMTRTETVTFNPWHAQRLSPPSKRHGQVHVEKRPFTPPELAYLLEGTWPTRTTALSQRLDSFMLIGLLSGMRLNEIASLTVGDCDEGWFCVGRSKTEAGVRFVPQHTLIQSRIARLVSAARQREPKRENPYLFALPEQKPGSKRERGAPVTQAFTRYRRSVGVDERARGQRQSAVDFHSFRRTFVRLAINALCEGAQGFIVQTIAEVIGHEIEDGKLEGVVIPNGLTVGTYGKESPAHMKRACVEAVRLVIDRNWDAHNEDPGVKRRLKAIQKRGAAAAEAFHEKSLQELAGVPKRRASGGTEAAS